MSFATDFSACNIAENMTMKFKIISALLRSKWFIQEEYAIAHGGVVTGLLNGMLMESSVSDEYMETSNTIPFAISAAAPGRKYSIFDDAPKGSIAVIPVRGPLMKDDQQDCGYFNAGMETLGNRIEEADKHPNISGIILYIDSPGGTVDGTQNLADRVKSSQTPVVAFVDGLMASAAMWIGSSTSYIIAQNDTTEIGSIGVMIAFSDMQPMWEKEGVVFHRINADQSSDKNKGFTDALKGDYTALREEQLNPLADQFISTIKANRPTVDASVFTGKVFFAKDALTLGLIDEIGPFSLAVETVSRLAAEKEPTNKIDIHKPIKSETMNLPILTSLLQVASIENTEEGSYLNADQLQAIEDILLAHADQLATQAASAEQLLSAHESEVSALTNASDQHQTAFIQAQATIQEIHASLDQIHPDIAQATEFTSKIEVLRSILSSKISRNTFGTTSSNDDLASCDGVDWDRLNNLPHMKDSM